MDFQFIYETFIQLLPGLPLTVGLAVISVVLGGVLGFVVALLSMSSFGSVRAVAWLYVQLFRSVPLLVLLFIVYYGVSQFEAVRQSVFWPFLREPFWCVLLALTLNTSPYAAEIIRGGLKSVSRGELEAASACGMSRVMRMRRIIAPLAMRQALPAYGNELIAMVKATALASLVTLMDVTGIATTIASQTYRPIEVYVSAGIIYFAMSYAMTRVVRWSEYKLSANLRPPVLELSPSIKEKTA
jgi:octopine/nopaline transport system permease protein